MTAWILSIVLNVSVTVAIATRLWWIDRTVASLTASRTNRYTSTIFIVIESGAVFAATTISMLALYITNGSASLTGLDIASQLAVCVPPFIPSVTLTESLRLVGIDTILDYHSGWSDWSISHPNS